MAPVDAIELETKVKDLYRHVAEQPNGAYHFEAGHALAERPWVRGRPSRQDSGRGIESFAGVGYFVDLADLRPGERVMDLGSGSGMDTFVAGALARLRRSQDRPGEPHQRAGDLGGGAASPLALILVDLRRQRRQQHLD
jgi:hypothetical protein